MVCYGNELMGNDAFGKAVYDALPNGHDKLFEHQLFPELLEGMQQYDRVVFVDASIGEGEVVCYKVEPSGDLTSNFHHLTPQVFLMLLSVVYSKTIDAHICTAYFSSFEHSQKDDDFDLKVDLAIGAVCQLLSK